MVSPSKIARKARRAAARAAAAGAPGGAAAAQMVAADAVKLERAVEKAEAARANPRPAKKKKKIGAQLTQAPGGVAYLQPAGNKWAQAEQACVNNALAFMEGLLVPGGQGLTYFPDGTGSVCATVRYKITPAVVADGSGIAFGAAFRPCLYGNYQTLDAVSGDTLTWSGPLDNPEANTIFDDAWYTRCIGMQIDYTPTGANQNIGSLLYVGQFPYQGMTQVNAPTEAENFTVVTSKTLLKSGDTTEEFTTLGLKPFSLSYLPNGFQECRTDRSASVGASPPTFVTQTPTMFGFQSTYTTGAGGQVPMLNEGYIYVLCLGGNGATDVAELTVTMRINYIPQWTTEDVNIPQIPVGSMSDLERAWSALVMYNDFDPINQPREWRLESIKLIRELAKVATGGGSFWSALGRGLRKVGNVVGAELKSAGANALTQILRRGAAEAAGYGGMVAAQRKAMKLACDYAVSINKPEIAKSGDLFRRVRKLVVSGMHPVRAVDLLAERLAQDALHGEEKKEEEPTEVLARAKAAREEALGLLDRARAEFMESRRASVDSGEGSTEMISVPTSTIVVPPTAKVAGAKRSVPS